MKTKIRNSLLYVLSILFALALLLGVVLTIGQQPQAFAETSNGDGADAFVVTETADEVLAKFIFTVINDTECSVRIDNKATATKAIVPSTAEISGKKYKVTEVTASGFSSATMLTRVSLPYTIKKIGNMAFANCTSLERVSLSNVEELGSNVFYNCKKLEKLVLPKSLTKIGATILRNADTQVLVRSEAAQAGWATNWNTGNSNSQVEYSSTYVEPLVLEKFYSQTTRSAALEGYVLAGGQPRTDNFYADAEENNVFIPNMYNGEYILAIEAFAFDGSTLNQLIVEFSSNKLMLDNCAFYGVNCNNITINRDVVFVSPDDNLPTGNIFDSSTFQTVVLPDTLTGLADQMFVDCKNLTNVYFIKPSYIEKRSDMLKIVDNYKDSEGKVIDEGIVNLPQSSEFTSIGEMAFAGVVGVKEIHIYENVKNVKASIFAGWQEDQRAIIHIAEEELPTFDFDSDTGWHPQWSYDLKEENVEFDPIHLTFTLNPNGGAVSPTTLRVKRNEAIGNLPVPTYAHHSFLGWYGADGQPYTNETVFTGKSGVELFARWKEFTYTVEYDFNRPNFASSPVVGEMDVSKVAYSEVFALLSNGYTIKGWTFVGWNTNKDGSGDSFADGAEVSMLCEANDGTVVLYAQWTENVYTLKFDSNRPDTYYPIEGQMPDVELPFEESHALSCNFSLKGWTLKYWSTSPDGSGKKYFAEDSVKGLVAENNATVTLYAQWEIETYVIEYKPENIVHRYSHITSYTVDSEIVFEPYEQGGYLYSFSPLTIEKGSTGVAIIYVSMRSQEYYIHYDFNGATTIPAHRDSYNIEDHVTFPIPQKEGFHFLGWRIVGTDDFIESTVGCTGDLHIEAVWSTVLYVGADWTEVTVGQYITAIVLPSENFTAATGLVVKIPDNITRLEITSATSVTYTMRVEILDRSADLELILDGVSMRAPIGATAILSHSADFELTIYAKNACAIYGGRGADGKAGSSRPSGILGEAGETGDDGAVAIRCSTLILRTFNDSSLTVIGGRGGDGGKGGYGGSQAAGGPGGDGGKGGFAVVGEVFILGNNVKIIGGTGGDGGEGGGSSLGMQVKGGFGGQGSEAICGSVYGESSYDNVEVRSGANGKSNGNPGTI